MNKIIVKHSSIVINDYELGDCPKLEDFFSIYDMTYHTTFYKGIEYVEATKQLIVPRGIDIFYLEKLFDCEAVMDSKYDPYDYTAPIKLKYLPRDDRQKEALKFMLGEAQYNSNRYKSQFCVNLNTGFGKSYCSICTTAFTNIRSIVLTSSLKWLEQWKDYILEYTDIQPREIFFISGSGSIFSLLKKDMNKYKVILASLSTIRSYGEQYGWDKVSQLFKFMKVGLKFYDEAHLHFDTMCKIDAYTNTYKTYYVTATPARSNEDENFIYQLYFKNVPSIDLFDEDNDPHTKYIAIKYNSHPTPQQLSDCKNKYGLDRNKYVWYAVHNEQFYKVLHVLLDLAIKNGGKNLFYIGMTEAIDIVKDWICINYPELINDIGVFHSKVTENKDEQLNKRIILSTTKSCGAAVDIKGLKMTVVLAEPFKSEVLARQTLGRTRDDDTFYIEVVDTGFYYISKFYYNKKDIFAKYASECSEIVLSDHELDRRVDIILQNRKPKIINVVSFFNGRINPIRFYKPNEKIKVVIFVG